MPKFIRRTVSRTRLIAPARVVVAPAPVVVQEVIITEAAQLPVAAPVVVQHLTSAEAAQLPVVEIVSVNASPPVVQTITTVQTES